MGKLWRNSAVMLALFLVYVHLNDARTLRSRKSRLHFPPLGQPTFLRDAVESAPKLEGYSQLTSAYRDMDEFGTRSLPLRDAVESKPPKPQFRIPLRDAVERRPAPDASYRLSVEEENIETIPYQTPWYTNYQSFEVPANVYRLPQPVLPVYQQFQRVSYVEPQRYSMYNPFQQLFISPRGRSLDFSSRKPIPSFGRHVPYFDGTRKESQNYKLVCYIEGWSAYWKEPLSFTPAELDPFACTHVIYAFATIDPHSHTITPQDHEYDVVRGGYRAVTGLKRKNPDLKVLISVGGVRDQNAKKFSNMAMSAVRRQNFIQSLISFLTTYGFDGVDFHWQYPAYEELGGSLHDKDHFTSLIEEINETFSQYKWLVSVGIPASRFRLDDGYYLLKLARDVDFIILQAYDIHNERKSLADHHSPLQQRDHDKGLQIFYNLDYSIRYILKKNIPRSKLIVGIPMYGRTFTLAFTNNTDPGSPIKGPGHAGYYTQSPGLLSYYEVCEGIQNDDWQVQRDSSGSPYAVHEDQWIGFEDTESIQNKVSFMKDLGLGGAAAWAVDLDDFQGICGTKSPLLRALKDSIEGGVNNEEVENNLPVKPLGTCYKDGLYSDPSDCSAYYICRSGLSYHLACKSSMLFDVKTGQCNYGNADQCLPGQSILVRSNIDEEKKVVCYITNWAFYRKADGKFVPEHLDTRLCTHIVYAFASLEPEQLLIKEFDPWADLDNDLYERVTSLPDATVLLALGGWTDSAGDKYSRLVSDGTARRKFVLGVISFLRRHGFQGIHLDWNYPKCWQSDCRKGPNSDKPNFTKLIQELRKEFDKQSPPLVLAAAISGYKEVIDVAYELAPLGQALDFISVMTYDYHGSWEQRTGHVSPLYERPGDKYPQYNSNFTMDYLVQKGAPRQKLLLGIPFYGQTFTLSRHDGDYSVGAKTAGPGDAGEFTKQPGMLSYFEICHRVKNNRWQVNQDPYKTTGPFAYSRDQWVGYEDPMSIKEKTRYIMQNGFGGAVAWTVDLDDYLNRCCLESFPLLKSINRGLGRLSDPEPTGGDCTRPPAPSTPVAPTLTTGVDTGAMSTTPMHEHNHDKTTTWPTWSSSQKPTTPSTWWPQSSSSSTTPATTTTTTTTTKKPTTTTRRTTTSTTTSTTTTTTPPSTTSWWKPTEGTTIPSPAVVMPEVEEQHPSGSCETGQYTPDPQNCNAYYRCILGEMKKQYCAGGLHWNKYALVCDWPSEAKCTGEFSQSFTEEDSTTTTRKPTRPSTTTRRTTQAPTRTTTTTKAPTRTTTTKAPTRITTTTKAPTRLTTTTKKPQTTTQQVHVDQTCQTGQYYPNGEDCNSFYVCVNGVLISQQCGPGLLWSQSATMCDWQHNVKCFMEETQSILMTNTLMMKNRPDGPCDGGSYASYPPNCGQYLMCLWGKYQLRSCAPGLNWNNENKMCDWPARARCTPLSDEDFSSDNDNEIDHTRLPEATTGSYTTTTSTTPRVTTQITTTTRKTTTTTEAANPLSGQYKIVCYFTNWAWYRKGLGKYTPDHINTNLCTHIVYGFAVLNYDELIIKPHDTWADYDNKFYQKVTALKARGVKVTLALGGWNDSAGDKYSRLVNNPSARAKFIKHAIEFLKKHNFDGLDLDWEYPKCWQVNCDKGPDSDKPAFAAFLRELRAAFTPEGLLLSAAVSPSKTVVDAGYDVPAIAETLDWVAVMTYDFHGQWDKQTGHVAPLYYHPDDSVSFFNANYSINYWISEGVPREKIVMGMPLYGQSFQLENANNNGLNAKAPGPGQSGEFTRAAGFLAYYEICDRIKNRGWTVVHDPEHRMGPYAYKGNQWVSFDDAEMIRRKSLYIKQMKLGGGMIWALDLDDFKNRCGEGRHPLLNTIRNVLYDERAVPDDNEVVTTKKPTTTTAVVTQTTKKPSYDEQVTTITPQLTTSITTPQSVTDSNSQYKVVCYFTNWAWYRQGSGKYLPSDIDPDLCTHVVYGFAVLNGDQLIIKPHDSWADFDNKFYAKVTALKSKGVKVLIAIGGWNDSAGDKYSRLVNNPAARRKFITHVVSFIEENNFDGLDLDWEYPKCWQVDCNKGPASDKQAFADFVAELHEAFAPKNLLLSSAVSPSKRVVDAGYDVPALSRYLDWIAVMCYDYHGQWDKITGHVAPMYVHPEDNDVTFNTNFTINYWISQGADRKKIVLGMPMYGQSFSLADNSNTGLNSPTYGGGEAGEETRARGFLAYYEICDRIKNKGWKVIRDRKGRLGPYAYLRDQWVSFDDRDMLEHKSEYIKAMGLGGGMVWALDLDDFKNVCGCEEYPLLRTINRVLRNYSVPKPKCSLEPTTVYQDETNKKPVTIKPTKRPETFYHQSTTTEHSHTTKMCGGDLFVQHEADCSKYYLCIYGEAQEQTCPDGLHWNKDHCDWPENTDCTLNVIPGVEADAEIDTERPIKTTTTQKTTTTSLKPVVTVGTVDRPTRPSYPETDVGSSEYKVVCYFTNWAWYRQGDGKYTPDDIDTSLCTHITYGFAVLDPNTLLIKPHDSWADIDNNFYERVTKLKEKGLKVLIAIGGWNDSLGNKYSRLVNDPSARARFITNIVEFIDKWNFDGLDLDWEYPKCWQVDCSKGPDSDKSGFAALVAELRQAFTPHRYLLSSAVSPSKMVIDAGYDVPSLSKNFDWIAVMTYDFHGHWDKQTGHVAPLYYYPGDTYDYFNANFSLHYWMEKGAPAKKLIMGMPLYGQSFSLADTSQRGLNAKSYGPGEAGEFTRAGGFLAFYEICERVKQKSWEVKRDPEGRIGPYAYKGNQWVSYDDISEIRRKSQLVKQLGLGGGMIWALDLDDFRDRCGCGKHPLLKTLNNELRGISIDTQLQDCT